MANCDVVGSVSVHGIQTFSRVFDAVYYIHVSRGIYRFLKTIIFSDIVFLYFCPSIYPYPTLMILSRVLTITAGHLSPPPTRRVQYSTTSAFEKT